MRQTHGTLTLTNTLTLSHTCRQTSAWLKQFIAYFQAPTEIRSRCVRLRKPFATRPGGCSVHLPPPPPLAHAVHNGRGKWFGNTHFNLRFVCLSALSCPLWACPTCRKRERKEGEAKGRTTRSAAILKTSWETCQRVLRRQQVFQLCATRSRSKSRSPPCLGPCVCVLFLVESLIKFLIKEISGMRMSVWARHSWRPFTNILFMFPDTINCVARRSRSRYGALRSVSSNVAPRIC